MPIRRVETLKRKPEMPLIVTKMHLRKLEAGICWIETPIREVEIPTDPIEIKHPLC
jgi:hypothetical protein